MRLRSIILTSSLALLALPVAAAHSRAGTTASQDKTDKQATKSAYSPRHYRSRPDLKPPKIKVTNRSRRTSPGYIFTSVRTRADADQKGPLILDDRGNVVWFNPSVFTSNLHVINYMGQRALIWWEGKFFPGYGRGDWIIVDRSYKQIARIKAGNGQQTDFHDVRLTNKTAIVMNYVVVNRDLSLFGGAPNTKVLDNVVQEIDLESGKVLFQWSALAHVAFSESSRKPPTKPGQAYDFFHINSVDIDDDGNLLIGARRTDSIFKVHRKTGAVIWRLGGRHSTFEMGPGTESIPQRDAQRQADGSITIFDDGPSSGALIWRLSGGRSTFKMGPGTEFIAQHDAQRQADGSITIFDNGLSSKGYKQSRGISLKVDTKKLTAKLRRTNSNPVEKVSRTEGNFQALRRGHFLAGWGNLPNFTEFDRKGKVVYNAELPKDVNTYRAYKLSWSGRPARKPDIAVRERSGGDVRVYASWNGATGVRSWQVLTGSSPNSLNPTRTARKRGDFEVKIDILTRAKYFAVRALSTNGTVLATSKTIKR